MAFPCPEERLISARFVGGAGGRLEVLAASLGPPTLVMGKLPGGIRGGGSLVETRVALMKRWRLGLFVHTSCKLSCGGAGGLVEALVASMRRWRLGLSSVPCGVIGVRLVYSWASNFQNTMYPLRKLVQFCQNISDLMSQIESILFV